MDDALGWVVAPLRGCVDPLTTTGFEADGVDSGIAGGIVGIVAVAAVGVALSDGAVVGGARHRRGASRCSTGSVVVAESQPHAQYDRPHVPFPMPCACAAKNAKQRQSPGCETLMAADQGASGKSSGSAVVGQPVPSTTSSRAPDTAATTLWRR